MLAAKRTALTQGRERSDAGRSRRGPERFHPIGTGAGKRETRAGGRARVHVDVVPAGSLAGAHRQPDGRAKLQERMAAIRRLIEQ